MPQMPPSEFT